MKEIGSEYWISTECEIKKFQNQERIVGVLSGRTAIDYIIKDIKTYKILKKVILPSYCCYSMIEPFKKNNIEIQFYHVNENGINYKENDADAILLIDYFGYINPYNKQLAEQEKGKGKIIIYDATHNISGFYYNADYIFCSQRKWFYSNCTVIKKKNSPFAIREPLKVNWNYIFLKRKAALLKKEYMSGKRKEKEEFLKLFADAEKILDTDYEEYIGIEEEDIDIESIIKKRQKNAHHLVTELKECEGIRLWRQEISKDDVPLFVPILVRNNKRDGLRDYLKNNGIYCPIHWPAINEYDMSTRIYSQELSLICDQRYDLEDMDRQITIIKEYIKGKS